MAGFRLRLERAERKTDQPRGLPGADADFIAPEFDSGCLGHGALLRSAAQICRGFRIGFDYFCLSSPK